MKKTAIYTRISQDREGSSVGVKRQEEDARRLAADRGWDVVHVYSDNDISATSGKKRPAWEQLLKDLEAGKLDAVVAYSSSRMYRRPRDLDRLIELTKTRGVEIATVASGRIDLETADGRMIAGILAQIDQGEAERMGERISRAKRAKREQGLWNGGQRSYGYKHVPGGLDVVPEEVAVIREMVDRVLAGESPHRIAADLNDQGLRYVGGGRWRSSWIKRLLTGDQGTRTSLRGTPLIAGGTNWPAIISPDEVVLLRAAFAAKQSVRTRTAPPGKRRYALTGLLYCSECGCKLIGSGGYYKCAAINGGCRKVSVKARLLEDRLHHRIQQEREAGRTRDGRSAPMLPADSEERAAVLAEQAQIEAQMEHLSDQLAAPLTATKQRVVDRAIAKLEQQQAAADARLAALVSVNVQPQWVVDWEEEDAWGERWLAGQLSEAELEDLRAMFGLYFEAVQVAPRGDWKGKPRVGLDVSRIKVRWQPFEGDEVAAAS